MHHTRFCFNILLFHAQLKSAPTATSACFPVWLCQDMVSWTVLFRILFLLCVLPYDVSDGIRLLACYYLHWSHSIFNFSFLQSPALWTLSIHNAFAFRAGYLRLRAHRSAAWLCLRVCSVFIHTPLSSELTGWNYTVSRVVLQGTFCPSCTFMITWWAFCTVNHRLDCSSTVLNCYFTGNY